jgi:hypothetical protein
MKNQKIFGYIFIVLAILLTLALIGQLPKLLRDIFKIFTGKSDLEFAGKIIGTVVYLLFHAAFTFLLWIIGKGWTKNNL